MTPNAVRPARVAQDRSFTLAGLFGRQKIVVDGVPRGWVVKAIRYRGQDISDIATEFETDPKEPIEITLTSRTASVGGTVTDDVAGGDDAEQLLSCPLLHGVCHRQTARVVRLRATSMPKAHADTVSR